MKPRLIILSDLWGKVRSDWVQYYQESLKTIFDFQYYDCCELVGINRTNLKEETIHSQFVEKGINIAVRKLIELEKEKVSILAFSIGGTIAWKAGLEGLKIESFHAISSTRLRYETNKPNCNIKLYYGNKDNFIPSSKWFENLDVTYEIIKDGDHLIYADEKFYRRVCEEIKNHYDKSNPPTSP